MVEIALLHHVTSDTPVSMGPRADYFITPSALEQFLKDREKCPNISGKYNTSEAGCLLTFDDGYKNNLEQALPLLEKYEREAIIFITTGFINQTAYPYELELGAVIQDHNWLYLPFSRSSKKTNTPERQRSVYNETRLPLKRSSIRQREDFMQRLGQLNNYERRQYQQEEFLSWAEVRTLDRHPLITIGAHTHAHPLLNSQLPWNAYREMKLSKHILEHKLKRQIPYFAYPYGGYNRWVRGLARWCGFKWCFTTEERKVQHKEDPWTLPRIDINRLVKARAL